MKVTYTADDGTQFYDADECLAYEDKQSRQCKKWQQLMTRRSEVSEVLEFLRELDDSGFSELKDFWPYRQQFVELARTFIEADPTLKRLIDGY